MTNVRLRPLGRCTAGTSCPVTVEIQLRPRLADMPMIWRFQLVERCTGKQQQVPGGALTVPPNNTTMTAVQTVPLPSSGPLAVIAVTTQPVAAASPPLLVADPGFC